MSTDLGTGSSVTLVPLLVDGQWKASSASDHVDVFNPSTGKVIARTPLCSKSETNEVVEAAAAALPEWSATPAIERARVMFRLRQLMEENFEQLARFFEKTYAKTWSDVA